MTLKYFNTKASIGLPDSANIYEKEYEFWPWGELIKFIADWIEKNAPLNANVLDYMCGTGYLLNELVKHRSDLYCFGCSITREYIEYAQREYSRIKVELCDALKYKPPAKPDIVICNAGIHHLPWKKQPVFIEKVASEIETGKIFIVGEELICEYKNEKTRRLSVIEMLAEEMRYMIKKKATPEILVTAAELLKADLLAQEYKISMATIISMLNKYFEIEKRYRIWPHKNKDYGDYVFICRKR